MNVIAVLLSLLDLQACKFDEACVDGVLGATEAGGRTEGDSISRAADEPEPWPEVLLPGWAAMRKVETATSVGKPQTINLQHSDQAHPTRSRGMPSDTC